MTGAFTDRYQHEHEGDLYQHTDYGGQGRAGRQAEQDNGGGYRNLEMVGGPDHRRRRGIMVAASW